MTAAKYLDFISIEDYLHGELNSSVKHEYSGGYVYAMAGGTNTHNTVSVAFVSLMFAALRKKKCQPFNSDTKVRVQLATHSRFYYPDGMIVCNPNPGGDAFQDHPVVIAEVLSASTRRIDEGEKRDAYFTIPSLSVYLLIESTLPRIVAHVRTDRGFVAHRYEGLDAIIPLDVVGVALPLRDLYERVDFDAAAAEEAAAVNGDEAG